MDDAGLMLEAARLYYLEDMTQDDIAATLGVSRFKVSRLIKEARSAGYVQISVVSSVARCSELEEDIKRSFGIGDAIVVPVASDNGPAVRKSIGRQAAKYVLAQLKDGDALGIAWGRTVYEVVAGFRPVGLRGLRVVQVVGGMGWTSNKIYPHEIVTQAASTLHGSCHFLHCPALIESDEARNTITSTEAIRAVIDIWDELDVAVVGLGTLQPDAPLVQGTSAVAPGVLEHLRSRGAVGELCGRFYDISGNVCDVRLNRCVVGLSPDHLRRTRCAIGVVGGREKVEALLGALRGRFFDAVVTDEFTAVAVLKAHRMGLGQGTPRDVLEPLR
ncbi:MAG: sugar-binding transcriptional regulator [Firmicutes bacterium]|jgi:DNA-binding transcriptional regulator LsrR (DeoR family)|nr:sugar-binding transcriptional regulator [Bacillota bacterium]